MNIKSTIIGLLRSAPIMIMVYSFIVGLIFKLPFVIYFSLYCLLASYLFFFLKKFFKDIIYKDKKKIPILGMGARPKGAKHCGQFINEDNLSGVSTSYGMPSGHAGSMVIIAVFWIMYLLDNQKNTLYRNLMILLISSISFSVMASRYYFKCHTIEHIVVGGFFGLIFGLFGYNIYNH